MTTKKRELDSKEIAAYSVGFFGLMLLLTTFNTFSYNYIIYVIGLDPYLAAIGTSLGLVFMAFGGPLFGFASDNLRPTKYGRRRPFILYGTPVLIVLFIGLWLFPIKCNYPGEKNWGVAIYYWIFCVLFCVTYQAIWAPYMAMLPEISETQNNRIAIASSQGLFNLVATVIGLLLPFFLISGVEEPESQLFYQTSGGKALMWQMLVVALIFAGVSAVALLTTFKMIQEPCRETTPLDDSTKSPEECKDSDHKSLKEVMGAFWKPLTNRDFANWSTTNFIVNFAMRIPMTIIMPFITFVLEIQGAQMMIFMIAVLPFVGGGFFLWQKLSKTMGLKKCYQVVVMIITAAMLSAAIFLFKPQKTTRLIVGFIIVVLIVSTLVAMFILPNPITSKIIDHEVEYRLEEAEKPEDFDQYQVAGKFFGVNSFTFNLSGAIGFQLLGLVLGSGGSKDYWTIALMLPLTAVIAFFALFSARRLTLGKRKPTRLKDIRVLISLIAIAITVVILLAVFI